MAGEQIEQEGFPGALLLEYPLLRLLLLDHEKGGEHHQFAVFLHLLGLARHSQGADDLVLIDDGQGDARLHPLQPGGLGGGDRALAAGGDHLGRGAVKGPDPLLIPGRDNDAVHVHDIHIDVKHRHGAVHDGLGQRRIQHLYTSAVSPAISPDGQTPARPGIRMLILTGRTLPAPCPEAWS